MRIRWTELAQRDFTNICDYTEEQSGPAAARRVALRIYEAIDLLERFRNYCGLIKVARSGFPWEKTTKGDMASVYTNCETALVQFPSRGRPGRQPDTRELIFTGLPFLAVYRLREDVVEITRILHGAQKWP
jgi:plasmid stabilization system protein ParE